MNERQEFLAGLLSSVESGKLNPLVAASMAGLIQPCEEISKDAALFRLQWELENAQE